MSIIVINVKTEKLAGGFHIFSPQVPAFHIADQPSITEAFKKGLPILRETVTRRAREAGMSVTLRPATLAEVTLADLHQLASKPSPAGSRQFVAEFSPI